MFNLNNINYLLEFYFIVLCNIRAKRVIIVLENKIAKLQAQTYKFSNFICTTYLSKQRIKGSLE